MEPRGSLGVYDRRGPLHAIRRTFHYPHRVRNALASNIFKVPEHKIRVVAGDIGGASAPRGGSIPSTS